MRRTEKAPVLTKIGPYFLDKVLGSGGFGIVKLGTHESTGDTVAVKIISKEKLKIPRYVQNTRNEIRHLKLFIRHPRIIKLYEVMFSPTNLVLIMERAHGGNLKRYLEARERKIPIEDIRRFFQQIISGLDFCHSHNVMHRDLKPSNILLDGQNNIKIADFGLSCELEDGRMFDSFCGSAYYMSPEICEGRAYIGPEADIWSCGIMLYEMMFRHLTQVADRAAFLSGIENRVFVTSTTMDADLRTLMMHMLHYDAAQRATMKAIRDNAWFQTNLDPALFPSPLENDDFIVHPEIVLSICEMLKATETEVRRALLDGNPENEINKAYKTFQESQLKERPAVRETLYPVIENTQAISPTKTEKWSLGIKVKDVEGHVVMLELYAILRDQEYEWHTIDYYHIIVRKRFKTTARYNLMSLQLYRRGPENVLDFRNLGFQYPGTSGSSVTSSSVSETVSDVPKPPTDAPKPPTDAPKPPTDAPKPPTDTRLDTSGSSSVSYLNSSYGSTGETTLSPESDSVSSLSVNDLRRHEVMEFFEMCSGIFNALRLRLHQLIHY